MEHYTLDDLKEMARHPDTSPNTHSVLIGIAYSMGVSDSRFKNTSRPTPESHSAEPEAAPVATGGLT